MRDKTKPKQKDYEKISDVECCTSSSAANAVEHCLSPQGDVIDFTAHSESKTIHYTPFPVKDTLLVESSYGSMHEIEKPQQAMATIEEEVITPPTVVIADAEDIIQAKSPPAKEQTPQKVEKVPEQTVSPAVEPLALVVAPPTAIVAQTKTVVPTPAPTAAATKTPGGKKDKNKTSQQQTTPIAAPQAEHFPGLPLFHLYFIVFHCISLYFHCIGLPLTCSEKKRLCGHVATGSVF